MHEELIFTSLKLIEKSRECHKYKSQPTTDTKRKRKMIKHDLTSAKKKKKKKKQQTIAWVPNRGDPMLNKDWTKTRRQGKTQHETPRSKNHKATQK